MPEMPTFIETYLRDEIRNRYSPAFIRFDSDYLTREWGGYLVKYGLENLKEGMRAESLLVLLEGLIPLKEEKLILKLIEIIPGVYTDIHLLKKDGSLYALFIDVSRQIYLNRKFQQKHNELKLEHHKYVRIIENSVSNDILAELDIALLRWIDDDLFIIISEKPAWFESIFPGDNKRLRIQEIKKRISSLADFLENNQSYWRDGASENPVAELEHSMSGNGKSFIIQIQALTVRGKKLLALKKNCKNDIQ